VRRPAPQFTHRNGTSGLFKVPPRRRTNKSRPHRDALCRVLRGHPPHETVRSSPLRTNAAPTAAYPGRYANDRERVHAVAYASRADRIIGLVPAVRDTPQPDFAAFRRRLWIIVVCTIVGGAVAYLHASDTPKTYKATAQLLFSSSSSLQQLLGLPSGQSQDPTTASATDVALASLPVLSTLTSAALGNSVPPGGVSVSATAQGVSDVVDVTATSSSPALAARVADVYCQQFISYTRNQQAATVSQAIKGLQRQIQILQGASVASPQLSTLQGTLAELETVGVIEPVNVELAQNATLPTSPSTPHPTLEAALGLLIGAVIGFIAALLAERFDPRLHSLTNIADDDSLWVVPWTEAVATPERSLTDAPRQAALRALRLMVRRLKQRNGSVGAVRLLVTSIAGTRERRSRFTVAWDLARAAATLGADTSVVFLELDTRPPSDVVGLAEVLAGRAGLAEAIHSVQFSAGSDSGTRTVDVISWADVRLGDDAETVMTHLASTYDYVVIDAPPPDDLYNAAFLLDEADAVLAVTCLHRSRRDATQHLADLLLSRCTNEVMMIGLPRSRR
jgi:succinoglycan biosynthesis transport protein ExoP